MAGDEVREASSLDGDVARTGIDIGRLGELDLRELGIRFAFGAVISIAAGVVGAVWGPRVGGLFLAFPAIMPASLTLIEKKEGRRAADRNASGAVIGAVALAVFASVAFVLFEDVAAPVVLVAATGAWSATAGAGYLVARRVLRLGRDDEPFRWSGGLERASGSFTDQAGRSRRAGSSRARRAPRRR